jgi:hypothetical protein
MIKTGEIPPLEKLGHGWPTMKGINIWGEKDIKGTTKDAIQSSEMDIENVS